MHTHSVRFDAPLLRRAAGCLAVLLPVAAGHLGAQGGMGSGESHLLSIGFGGGLSVPVSNAKDAFKNGINGEGFLLVHLGPLPAVRINLSYQKFDLKDELRKAAGFTGASNSIAGGDAGLSFSLFNGPISPYLTAGLGAFNVKTSSDDASTNTSTSNIDFGITGGAGLAITIGRVSGFAEGRVQNVYTKSGGAISAKSIQSVPVTFGILIGL